MLRLCARCKKCLDVLEIDAPEIDDLSVFDFTKDPPLSLYVHLPWCVQKCPYCDFNSYALHAKIPESEYLTALLSDLDSELLRIDQRSIECVYIGGGTPSLFSTKAIERLILNLQARRVLTTGAEITLEANPGAIERQKFAQFLDVGVNRLSIGVQSFNDELLRAIGRIHSSSDAIDSVDAARKAGFNNINIDLMFGLPGQSLRLCHTDLTTAIGLAPQHISYYQLTVEPNTIFHARPPLLPHGDALWEMQMTGNSILRNHGYNQYEVSAYSRQDCRCKHNMNYWEFGDYLGIGAGAHGKLTSIDRQEIQRTWKTKQPRRYIRSVRESREQVRRLTAADVVSEFMLNALRLNEGVPIALFRERTGLSIDTIERQLGAAVDLGLLAIKGQRWIPTVWGQRFLDDLIMLFVQESAAELIH